MAHKDELRNQRTGTIINAASKKMEKEVMIALDATVKYIVGKFAVALDHVSNLFFPIVL
jgi:hypothetical protein